MKRINAFSLLALCGALVLGSCTKEPLNNITDEESRIYVTNRDSTAAFGTYKTFSIVDSVSVIDNNRFAGKEAQAWDRQVVAAVADRMISRGYTRVARSQSPDLGINVSRIYNTTTSLVDLSGYWNNYGGYYDPYYWGYGDMGYNFPPAYGLYQSTEGALSIDLLDLKNASGNGSLKGVWNGLVRGTGIFETSTIEGSVQALFTQSPYINSNQ
ncbi:MAG TPA: DUF4136 domain-containing protein [Flavisolibacter sp.]|jgi:hypothetical protein|nr:DUF4136 domain-containing protein [Flavisolibacter sp.]